MDGQYEFIKKLNDSSTGVTLEASLLDEETFLIKVIGSVDTYNTKEFEDAIFNETKKISALKYIALNLEEMRYLSSTAVGSLVNMSIYYKKNNIKFFLMKISNKVEEVLSLLGILKMINVISDIDEIKTAVEFKPSIVECLNCQTKLKILKPGKYRCLACKQEFRIDDAGFILKI